MEHIEGTYTQRRRGPRKRTKSVMWRMYDEHKVALDKISDEMGISNPHLIELAVIEWLEKRGHKV